MYIVYNQSSREVYTITEEKPIDWTPTNGMAEVENQEINQEKQYLYIGETLIEKE